MTDYKKKSSESRIKLGICAMQKKVNSKHMQNILKGLDAFDEFEIIIFEEDLFFNKEIEDWPIVDSLIIFFSNGFPYSKGLKYLELRKPFLINDFKIQKVFWDRRQIYKILEENKIPTPNHIMMDRGEEINNDNLKEDLNSVEEIEKMIFRYTEYAKELKEDKRKNPKRGDSFIEPKDLNKFTNSKDEKVLSSPSTTSLINLEDYYFSYNGTYCNSNIGSKKNSLACNTLQKSNSENIGTLSHNISFIDNSEPYPIDKETFQNTIQIEEIVKKNSTQIEITQEMINKLEENIMKKSTLLEDELIENDDFIEYKGKKIYKPFVEKPCNGDDHNIYIYYPPSLGGGHKRLFRKTKNLSSLYIPNEDNIRRDKSYIYEEFLQTDGFDIKVYTIGPEYFHAEARKAPSLDGVVRRSPEGKEVRYPINLTPYEKEFSRKIVSIFKQNICGFDILRSKGKSYVCDVNGWSFVKGNRKYYEDCVVLIRKMILMHVDPLRYEKKPLSLQIHVPTYEELILPHRPKPQNQKFDEELRSVVAIFRHGDRSPKQKMKLVVTERRILDLYKKYANNSLKEVKLKKPKHLMEVLRLTQEILADNKIDDDYNLGINDTFLNKIIQLKMVLEKNVNFEGMTRKVQIKPLKFHEMINEKGDTEYILDEALFILKWGGDITHSGIEQARLLGNTFRVQIYPNYMGEGDGLLRLHSTYRHDLKCYSSEEGRCMKTAAAFLQGLLQFDGNLIPIISSMVRKDEPVLDMLDVSSDEICDLKKKVKEELTECLNHDGNLLQKFKNYFKNQAIFQSSESKDKVEENHSLFRLMDKINNPLKMMNIIYNLMDKLIQYIKTLLTQEEIELDSGTYLISRPVILQRRKTSDHCSNSHSIEQKSNHSYRRKTEWESLFDKRNTKKKNDEESNYNKPDFDCEDEKIILIYKRWIKLYQDFYNVKKQLFDVSKIPDIYDNIKYDLIHNRSLLNDDAYNLFYNINLLANFVMPLEYGITVEEKVKIGVKVIGRLLNKIHNDLLWWCHTNSSNVFYNNLINSNIKDFEYENESYSGLDRGKLNNDIKSAWRHVKTRFYFTSASHLYSLINTIIFGIDSFLIDLTDSNQIFIKQLKNVLDLDYLSHIMFRLYENFNFSFDDPKRFRLEIIMSAGSNKSPPDSDEDHLIPISPWIILNKNLTLKEMEEFFAKLKQQNYET